jgi:hypothetical protein
VLDCELVEPTALFVGTIAVEVAGLGVELGIDWVDIVFVVL